MTISPSLERVNNAGEVLCKRGLGDNSSIFGPFNHVEDAREGSDGSELFVLSHVRVVLESIHALGAEDHDLHFGGDVRADGLNDDCLDGQCQAIIDGTPERSCILISSDQLVCILSPNFEGTGSGVAVGMG